MSFTPQTYRESRKAPTNWLLMSTRGTCGGILAGIRLEWEERRTRTTSDGLEAKFPSQWGDQLQDYPQSHIDRRCQASPLQRTQLHLTWSTFLLLGLISPPQSPHIGTWRLFTASCGTCEEKHFPHWMHALWEHVPWPSTKTGGSSPAPRSSPSMFWVKIRRSKCLLANRERKKWHGVGWYWSFV